MVALLLQAAASHARSDSTNLLTQVAFEQNLNRQIPLGARFRDDTGRRVSVGDCLAGKPAILVLGYNECPMLCSLVLNGLIESLRSMKSDETPQFNVISLSIHPEETPELAATRKANYLKQYGQTGADKTWHFLTGEEEDIRQVAGAVGFHYAYDPVSGEYAHPSGIVVLTPDGRVSRYFFGISYPPKELRQALADAGEEKISSPVRRLLLLCFHYDPENSRYGALVTNGLRIGGLMTMAALGLGVVRMLRKERRKHRTSNAEHRASNDGSGAEAFGVQRSMFDVRCSPHSPTPSSDRDPKGGS